MDYNAKVDSQIREENASLKQKVEDLEQEVFDKNNVYLRERSRADGIQKHLEKLVDLELCSIEDILGFMNTDNVEDARKAIKEQVRRIRKIFGS